MVRWSVVCWRCRCWYTGLGNTAEPYRHLRFVLFGKVYRPICLDADGCNKRIAEKIKPYQLAKFRRKKGDRSDTTRAHI